MLWRKRNVKRDTIWTKSFVLVMILNFLCGVVGMMTLPLVLEYAKEIGAGLTLASTAASLMSFVSLVICPFAGYISDRFDRKKILFYRIIPMYFYDTGSITLHGDNCRRYGTKTYPKESSRILFFSGCAHHVCSYSV